MLEREAFQPRDFARLNQPVQVGHEEGAIWVLDGTVPRGTVVQLVRPSLSNPGAEEWVVRCRIRVRGQAVQLIVPAAHLDPIRKGTES